METAVFMFHSVRQTGGSGCSSVSETQVPVPRSKSSIYKVFLQDVDPTRHEVSGEEKGVA